MMKITQCNWFNDSAIYLRDPKLVLAFARLAQASINYLGMVTVQTSVSAVQTSAESQLGLVKFCIATSIALWTSFWLKQVRMNSDFQIDMTKLLCNFGSVDLLLHFTKVKCNFWTQFFCMVLVAQRALDPVAGIPLGNQRHAEKLSPKIALHLKCSAKVKQHYPYQISIKRVGDLALWLVPIPKNHSI